MVNTILREADLFLSEQRRINFTIYLVFFWIGTF
ncbi:ABC transporter ATP-binding protein [Lactobacillus helveticus]|nr:ABC transporter ATP-binding protein [Lactobacillus helveticus]